MLDLNRINVRNFRLTIFDYPFLIFSILHILKDTQNRAYERVIRKKDGKEMVLIRGGNFEMGDAKSDPEE